MTPTEHETDALSGLEDRIQKAVQLVARLREEKEAALQDAADAHAQVATLSDENKTLQGEVKTLQADRAKVRARIEKLLRQIDELSAG
jgi:chromosome segregation ATPase